MIMAEKFDRANRHRNKLEIVQRYFYDSYYLFLYLYNYYLWFYVKYYENQYTYKNTTEN